MSMNSDFPRNAIRVALPARWILGGLTFASLGCAHFSPMPIDPARNAAALSGHRLAPKTWTLEALVKQAASTHPDVAIARAQYETARAAIRTAAERPNPTVALTPQIITPYTNLISGTYGVDFDWTLETAGKRRRRGEVAIEGVHAAGARVIDAVWKARVAVRKAYLDLYAAGQRSRLLNEAIVVQSELLRLMEARIQAGEEPRSSTAQARLLQAQLRLQLSDAGRSAALARVALAEALGMSSSGLLGVQFSFSAFERTPGRPGRARREALTHRADVLAALADYAVAEATLRLEISKQYPDLHLNPGYQLDAGVNKWTLGLGFAIPVLNQNRGAIGEAEARRTEAAAKFNAVQAKVLADCDRAAASVNAARARLAVTGQLLAEQAAQIATEERVVALGEADKTALLSARVERATTLNSDLDARIELQAALGLLEEATQSPLN